eukprot:5156289-Pleurochrysis_carterae.AAC.2
MQDDDQWRIASFCDMQGAQQQFHDHSIRAKKTVVCKYLHTRVGDADSASECVQCIKASRRVCMLWVRQGASCEPRLLFSRKEKGPHDLIDDPVKLERWRDGDGSQAFGRTAQQRAERRVRHAKHVSYRELRHTQSSCRLHVHELGRLVRSGAGSAQQGIRSLPPSQRCRLSWSFRCRCARRYSLERSPLRARPRGDDTQLDDASNGPPPRRGVRLALPAEQAQVEPPRVTPEHWPAATICPVPIDDTIPQHAPRLRESGVAQERLARREQRRHVSKCRNEAVGMLQFSQFITAECVGWIM